MSYPEVRNLCSTAILQFAPLAGRQGAVTLAAVASMMQSCASLIAKARERCSSNQCRARTMASTLSDSQNRLTCIASSRARDSNLAVLICTWSVKLPGACASRRAVASAFSCPSLPAARSRAATSDAFDSPQRREDYRDVFEKLRTARSSPPTSAPAKQGGGTPPTMFLRGSPTQRRHRRT